MRYFYNRAKSARRRLRMRIAAQAGIVAAVILVWSAAAAGTLNLTVRNGLVTLDAHAVPLGEVLRDLSQKAGFRLAMKKELYAPVTWRLQDVPVDEAIARLLAQTSSVILYAPAVEGANPLLTEVRILRGGDNNVPLVEHQTALANVDGTLAGRESFEVATAGLPAHNQFASTGGLQPAARGAAPANQGRADLGLADRRTRALPATGARPGVTREASNTATPRLSAEARQLRVQELIGLGGEESVSDLSRMLLEDPAPRVRRMAAAGLGRMNTESAFWALMEASSDSDQGVREAVSAALLRLERQGADNGSG